MKDINSLVRNCIRDMVPYESARNKSRNSETVLMDANENPFGNRLNRYPDPFQNELKVEISNISGIGRESIFLGNGSDEVLDILIRAFCEPGQDSIVITPPTYGMYKVLADINNVNVLNVPLTKDFQINANEILARCETGVKVIFLNSPNNPSGNLLLNDHVEKVVRNSSCLVLIDEAYIDFALVESWKNRIPEFTNLVVCQTLSKAYGMAGARLGIAYANEQIISIMNKIKPPYNISTLAQDCAFERLQNPHEQDAVISIIVQERKKLESSLSELPFVQTIFHSDSNFLLIKFDCSNHIYEYLWSKNIAVRDVSGKLECSNCLRITVGTPEQNKLLLNVLKEFKYEESTVY